MPDTTQSQNIVRIIDQAIRQRTNTPTVENLSDCFVLALSTSIHVEYTAYGMRVVADMHPQPFSIKP